MFDNVFFDFKLSVVALVYRIFFYILKIIPIKQKKIVVSNFDGKGFGDNPKYVVLRLLKESDDLDIVWLVNNVEDNVDFPKKIRIVKNSTMRACFELATAKVWIDNTRKPYFVFKRKGQFYVQTWHAGTMLKKVEKDAVHTLTRDYIKSAIHDSSMIDTIVSNSKYLTNIYMNSFWYSGEILECGLPKTDVLFHPSIGLKEKIQKEYTLPNNVKILLYAPTFRNSHATDIYDLEIDSILQCLNKKFKGDFICLVRLHPAMSTKKFKNNSKYCYNVTSYSDMQELLAISDVLITDYSSTMFEFAYNKKPVFLYATDKEFYNVERGYYFDIEELPFSFSNNNYELMKNISEFSQVCYNNNIDSFDSIINLKEQTNSSQQVANLILERIYKSL